MTLLKRLHLTPRRAPWLCDWATPPKHGQDVIIVPAVSDAEAKTLFPQGFTTVKPYLRIVRLPQ
jgi:hypothetical protein